MAEAFSLVKCIRAIYSQENDLTAYERLVVACLARHADTFGECFPGQPTVAKECGIAVRTARNAIEGLDKKGWVRRFRENGKVTRYLLTPAPDAVTPAGDAATPAGDAATTAPDAGVGGEPRQEMPGTPARDASEGSQLSNKEKPPLPPFESFLVHFDTQQGELVQMYWRELAETTRKSKRITDTVKARWMQKWVDRYTTDVIIRSMRIHLNKYMDGDKTENYTDGIMRGESRRNNGRHEVEDDFVASIPDYTPPEVLAYLEQHAKDECG